MKKDLEMQCSKYKVWNDYKEKVNKLALAMEGMLFKIFFSAIKKVIILLMRKKAHQ